MTGGQPLAVVLALAGSGCYAVAAVTQQRVASRLPSGRAFDPAVLVRLIRRPAWLAALVAVVAGFVLQAAALGLGRLVVIEPVLASGLLFALALAAWRDRRMLSGAEWAATLAVVGGLALFLVVGQPAGGQRTASAAVLVLAAAAATALVVLCVILAGRFTASRRALLFGVGGGVAAGVTDALIKSVTVLAAGHLVALLADARLYVLIVVGLLTYTIQQNGYRAAGLAAFLPAFSVLEPVTGALLGLVIYHERLTDGPGQIALELAAGAAMTWGIVRLARSDMVSGAHPAAGPAPLTPPVPPIPPAPPGPVTPPNPATPATPAESASPATSPQSATPADPATPPDPVVAALDTGRARLRPARLSRPRPPAQM
ncbi:MAG TPA: DMT family transporter [Streptosporangiaceae bacterium]|nr:DMT family transporter [Streptosporangiaceae bacterium]